MLTLLRRARYLEILPVRYFKRSGSLVVVPRKVRSKDKVIVDLKALGAILEGVRASRDNVVMVRTNKESLDRLDELVEGGIANSRSEAAAFLIAEGIKARQGLFDRISEKIEEIRRTKDELRLLIEEEDRGQPAPAKGSEPPAP